MAQSYANYTGTGVTTDYTLSFLYLDSSDVYVSVNGVNVAFSFLTTATIRCTVAPAAASAVKVYRKTQKTSATVNFTDGSVLLEADLDRLVAYGLYIAQEQEDNTADAVAAYGGASASATAAAASAVSAASAAGTAASVAAAATLAALVPYTGASAVTGPLTITTTGTTGDLTINDTSAGGANIKFHGNGGVTPDKYVRTTSGKFQILSHDYTRVLFDLDDSGVVDFSGNMSNSNPVGIFGFTGANYGQVRATVGDLYISALTAGKKVYVETDGSVRAILSSAGMTLNGDLTLSAAGAAISNLTSINNGPLAGFRNVVINGGFTVNQRVYVSAATLAAGVYGHDRWKAGAGGGDYSFTQLNSNTSITIAANKTLIQVVEDKNVQGVAYVLSWTGTALGRVGINSATPSGTYVASPILITGQTAGTTMSMEFGNGASAGTLSKVQLERGTLAGHATNFEQRPFAAELALCQRYYEKSFPYATAPAQNLGQIASGVHRMIARAAATASQFGAGVTFKATKRTLAGTATLYNPMAANSQVRDVTGLFDCSGSGVNLFDGGMLITCAGNASTALGNGLDVAWSYDCEI